MKKIYFLTKTIRQIFLYADSNNKSIKEDILNNYELLKRYIKNTESVKKSYIECELINAEHGYEFISLQWR